MNLILATRNRDKIKEIKKVLKGLKFKILALNDYEYFPKVKEDGKTVTENAVKKAKVIAKYLKEMSLADDTGLEVKALGGRPGVYSSRFAGPGCTYEDNNRKLLRMLEGVPKSKRKAVFKTIIALALPDGRCKTVEGKVTGRINDRIAGKNGFGYDPVFIPNGFKKTFAQMKLSVKNRISHRGKAVLKAKILLSKISRM